MELNWYSITPKLLEGVALSNTIPNSKFNSLLSHLFKAAKNQDDSPFTEEELKLLQNSLKFNESELGLMLKTLAYIVKRTMQFIIKPTTLEEDLTNSFKFSAEKSDIIVKIWTEYTKEDIGDLGQRQILDKFSWELNLELASDSSLKKTTPSSILQFTIKNNDETTENITVNMKENELLELYNQVENMQNVIDSLK